MMRASLPLLRLPMPHYTHADAWALLPPPAREAGRDYLRAERVTHRFAYGEDGILISRIDGWQAERVPLAIPDADGMRTTCSCGRRQPCAHVAALLLAYSEAPDTFRPLMVRPGAEELRRAMIGWASGSPFPWTEMETAACRSQRESVAEALGRASSGRALLAVRNWVETAPAERVQAVRRHEWREVLARAATPPVPLAEAGRFVELLKLHPQLDMAVVLHAVRPETGVEPMLLAALYRTEAEFMESARPSVLLHARTLALLYADWLHAGGHTAAVGPALQPFAVLKPAGIRLGDWLFTHGRHRDAERMWMETTPRSPTEARQREERLKLLARSAALADQEPE